MVKSNKLKFGMEVNDLANIKSALKRIEVAKRNTLRNKSKKTEIKSILKKFDTAIAEGMLDEARELLSLADKKLKKAVTKNIIHKNAASRRISHMAKMLNKAS